MIVAICQRSHDHTLKELFESLNNFLKDSERNPHWVQLHSCNHLQFTNGVELCLFKMQESITRLKWTLELPENGVYVEFEEDLDTNMYKWLATNYPYDLLLKGEVTGEKAKQLYQRINDVNNWAYFYIDTNHIYSW